MKVVWVCLCVCLCASAQTEPQPESAEGWFDAGTASYKLARYADAKEAFDKAGELAPQKGAVWAFLGLTEYKLNEGSTRHWLISRKASP